MCKVHTYECLDCDELFEREYPEDSHYREFRCPDCLRWNTTELGVVSE